MRSVRGAPAPRDSLNFRRASLRSRNEFESGTFTIVVHAISSFTYVSVIYGANFPSFSHLVRTFCSTRRSTRDPFALCAAAVQRKSDRCLRPAICMLARHTIDGARAHMQQARSGKSSSAMTSPGICLLSVAVHVCTLAFSLRYREGPSSKILIQGKASTLAASLSARSVLPKLPSEARLNLQLVYYK